MGEKSSHKLSKYRNSHHDSSLSNNVYLCASNETKVVSKYFKHNNTSMDESISDFQIPKKIVRPAKNNQQTKTTKAKLKKGKGQKDIRTVLTKKSDIINCTKDFHKACVDVDPEQLELAVALSTSLAEYKDKDLKTQGSICDFLTTDIEPCLSEASRITKIKGTLQKYCIKIKKKTIPNQLKIKKQKRKRSIEYDLRKKTKEDKAQIIADKFSQILFDCHVHPQSDKQYIKSSYNIAACLVEFYRFDASVYNKANYTLTECGYDDFYFYTNNLVEISTYKIGCFLRDWSAIPGRPSSPIRNQVIPHFDTPNVIQHQADLDKFLSCTVDICRSIIQPFFDKDKAVMEEAEVKDDQDVECRKEADVLNQTQNMDIRCNSPDIFDEESLEVIISPINNIDCNSDDELPAIQLITSKEKLDSEERYTQKDLGETTNPFSNDPMDVAECVRPNDVFAPLLDTRKALHLSLEEPKDNIYTGTNPGVNDEREEEKGCINLTQTSDSMQKILHSPSSENIDFIDLSQSSSHSDMTEVERDNIPMSQDKLDQSRVKGKSKILNKSEDTSIDLTQNSVYGSGDFDLKYDDRKSLSLPSKTTVRALDKSNDELFDSILLDNIRKSKSMESISYNSYQDIIKCDNKKEVLIPIESPIKYNSQSSLHSEVFEISDEEVNYSMNYRQSDESVTEISEHDPNIDEGKTYRKSENFDLYGSSLFDQISANFSTVQHSIRNSLNTTDRYCNGRESYLPEVDEGYRKNDTKTEKPLQQVVSPVRAASGNRVSVVDAATTPSNSEYVIKTSNITPMVDYKSLDTPERIKELSKYGLKPFKRKRAIQLLKHLYDQTHPLVEGCDILPQESDHVAKIRKLSNSTTPRSSPSKSDLCPVENVSPKSATHEKEYEIDNDLLCNGNEGGSEGLEVGEEITQMNIYEVTDYTPVVRNIPSDAFEWVFQKRENTKVQGCRVPLHIAFHNYVSARRRLKEAILRYEPIRIDIIHKQLVHEGFRYDSKDLLKFMDKKCITVKTADNSQCIIKRKQVRRTPIKRK